MPCTPDQARAAELSLMILGWAEAAGRGVEGAPEELAQLLAQAEVHDDRTVIEGLTFVVLALVDDLAQVLEESRADVLARFIERFRTFPTDEGVADT